MLHRPRPPAPPRSRPKPARGKTLYNTKNDVQGFRRRAQHRAAQARYRRYRDRVRDHRMVPQMPDIGEAEIEFLIATRWLAEADAADRRKVGDAIAAMLKASARARG